MAEADPGSAMCTLCGFARRIDANVERVEGVTSAMEFAVHFAWNHPDVQGGVSRFVVMVPEPPTVGANPKENEHG